MDFDEISGNGKQMFMISATGTAVVAIKNDPDIEAIISLADEMADEQMTFGNIENVRLKVLQMNRLLKRIQENSYNMNLNKKLFHFYYLAGEYAKAEDFLHKGLEEGTDLESFSKLITEGIKFYRDLLENKTDSELLKGNLSREKVIDELNRLKSKQL